MRVTTATVLYKYLEYKVLLLESPDWRVEKISQIPPIHYRYLQLQILFELYELGKLGDFEEGLFVEHRAVKEYQKVFETVESEMGEEFFREHHYNTGHVRFLFKKFMAYKLKIAQAASVMNSFLEGSGLYVYTAYKINQINPVVAESLLAMDKLLHLIISPQQKEYELEDLISKHHYPDVDLKQIDYEWIS